ncbi:MAG: MBOAT family protein, partial [Candidatus Nanopelagicales bacterium]
MSFAGTTFLWYFMPGFLLTYWTLPARWRNGVVAVFSQVFYTWGAGPFCLVLMSCMVVNYCAGIVLDRPQTRARPAIRKTILTFAVVVDLSVLAVWKYAGFASQQVDAFSSVLGFGNT